METVSCARCGKPAVVSIRYMSAALCLEHFNRFFEKRFRMTIQRHALFSEGETIAVGLSGGKDSVLLLHLLHRFFSRSNPLQAIIIDEGIPGYRDKAIELAVRACEKRGVPATVVAFQSEFGLSNADTAVALTKNPSLGKGVCGFCGTFRRSILNKYAKKIGAGKLATGHNLDDEAQSVLMNVFDNHFEKFARQGPVSGGGDEEAGEGFVPRIKPLFETPEKEIIAYCALNDIDHYSNECCPHSRRAKRNDFRQLLNEFETKYPGTKQSVVGFLLSARKNSARRSNETLPVRACARCGEPSNQSLCQACMNRERILDANASSFSTLEKNAAPEKEEGLSCRDLKEMAT